MSDLPCPICKQPAEPDRAANPYGPFCSRRCKMIDLGRWLGEGYRIPAGDDESDDGDGNVPPRGEGGKE